MRSRNAEASNDNWPADTADTMLALRCLQLAEIRGWRAAISALEARSANIAVRAHLLDDHAVATHPFLTASEQSADLRATWEHYRSSYAAACEAVCAAARCRASRRPQR